MKINYDSAENQEIKGMFVKREVLACFSYEMDAVLTASSDSCKGDLPTYDDIENMYYFDKENVIYKIMEEYPFEEKKMIEYANNPETYNRRVKKDTDFEMFLNSLSDDELTELCEEFNIDIYDEQSTPHEVFEWWIVTKFLYKKLQDKGQPVLEWGNNCYWGRCTTGQAILLDHVISEICEEMEILEGQKYSWAKK